MIIPKFIPILRHNQVDMSQKVALKRELGLLEVTLSGVGIILGAGIYALIGKAAGLAGNSLWNLLCRLGSHSGLYRIELC